MLVSDRLRFTSVRLKMHSIIVSEKNIIKGKRAVVKPKTYLDSSSEPHHPDKQIKPKTKKKAAKGDGKIVPFVW